MRFKKNKWPIAAVSMALLGSAAVQAAPNTEGRWSPVVDWPIIAIHSVLTPQGNVMNFGTDKQGLQGAQFFYDVWNPSKGTGPSSHNTLPNRLGVDSFCSAAVLMPNSGNILMAGGDTRPFATPNLGIKDAPIFNTRNNTLTRGASMSYARWYPTSTVLSNGEILVVGGKDGAGRPVTTPEIYSPTTNKWRSMFGLSTAEYPEEYPRQWVAPDGRVFGIFVDKTMYYLNPRGRGSTQFLNKLPVVSNIFQSSSVMYRRGKILHVGGSGSSTNDTVIININSGKPWVRAVAKPKQVGRSWVDSVVLPNGKVMIVGGSITENKLHGASYRPEIWDPGTERWSLMAPAAKPRLYHSTALLLKDGRVLVAGGGAPGPVKNTNAEIFSPPYLFNGNSLAARPIITNAPAETPYGGKLPVKFRSNKKISRVTLIKTGAVTHSFDMEQRFLELSFKNVNDSVVVDIPTSPNRATPGHYLLHLIDNQGVPSAAHIVRIASNARAIPAAPAPAPVQVVNPVRDTDSKQPVAKPNNTLVAMNAWARFDVLANDTGTGLKLVKPNVWSRRGGRVSLVNNRLLYKPKKDFIGTDTIWYVMQDHRGRKAHSQVNISVYRKSVAQYPVAVADWIKTGINTPYTINALRNDVGTGLRVMAVNQQSARGGRVSISNNFVRYIPKRNFRGSDSFWYTLRDSKGRRHSARVNVYVGP